jgi:hypothetical protein
MMDNRQRTAFFSEEQKLIRGQADQFNAVTEIEIEKRQL